MTPRCATPITPAEQALEDAVRALLVADGWTTDQQTHLLDDLLMVRRYPEVFAREVSHAR